MTPLYQNGFLFSSPSSLPLLTYPSFPFSHGFSTRLGGVSTDPSLSSLDLGMGEKDDVDENRRRFAAAFSLPPKALFFAKQLHSDKIETVTEEDVGRDFACDGFVTDRKGLLLAVKTADCVPILLGDRQAGVIGAVHAGWRGTVKGIVLRAIDAMEALGARPERIRVLIGPCIHSCCYEVDDPFFEAVKASPYASLLTDAVKPSNVKDGSYYADLTEMNRRLFQSYGVTEERIATSGFCTCCAPSLFFSHRASFGRRGLMMAGIAL